MIELKDVRSGYDGDEKLHGISLKLEKGKLTVIVGPNGCGKSTMLKTIMGIIPAQSGEIILDGQPISEMSRKMLAQTVAYMPQGRNIPSITARRMVLHGRFAYLSFPRRYRGEDYIAADKALEQLDVLNLAETQMDSLSGGERQKIFIAMALAQDTPVVLLDEPTSFLDIRHQIDILNLSLGLRDRGRTVVMVLHDLNLALKYADRVVVMQAGTLITSEAPEQIIEDKVIDEIFGVRVAQCISQDGEKSYCFN